MTTPRMYMHDVRLGNGTIVSTACTGADCEVCARDPAAAKRADNPYWPHELGEEPAGVPRRPTSTSQAASRKGWRTRKRMAKVRRET